jgi:toxin FitB
VSRIDAASSYLSVITIMELEIGILRLERRDQRQGAMLRAWLENHVIPAFAGRTLSIDAAVARRCARLHVPDPRSERDALIAATALRDGMTVVTRNLADFENLGVRLINPWGS